MRRWVGLCLLSACTGAPTGLEHRGSISNMEIDGVALLGRDGLGWAGMFDTLCTFNAHDGSIGADVDPTEQTEFVADGRGELGLARTATGLHVLTKNGAPDYETIELPGILDAGLAGTEPVALRRDGEACLVTWVSRDVSIAVGACTDAARLVTDQATDLAILIDEGDVRRVSPSEVQPIANGHQAVLDSDLGWVYVARGETLSATGLDGDVAWTVDLGSPVHSMDVLVDLGVFLTTEEHKAVLVDPMGTEVFAEELPATAQVVTNRDAEDIALIPDADRARDVHLYGLMR